MTSKKSTLSIKIYSNDPEKKIKIKNLTLLVLLIVKTRFKFSVAMVIEVMTNVGHKLPSHANSRNKIPIKKKKKRSRYENMI